MDNRNILIGPGKFSVLTMRFNKWSTEEMREMNKRNGVGRPPKNK